MNCGPEILHGNWTVKKYTILESIIKYIIPRISHAGADYKEVALKNHGNNGLAILQGSIFLPRKYTE